jgi:hypothetical protein
MTTSRPSRGTSLLRTSGATSWTHDRGYPLVTGGDDRKSTGVKATMVSGLLSSRMVKSDTPRVARLRGTASQQRS